MLDLWMLDLDLVVDISKIYHMSVENPNIYRLPLAVAPVGPLSPDGSANSGLASSWCRLSLILRMAGLHLLPEKRAPFFFNNEQNFENF